MSKKARILVVDDEPSMLRYLQTLLEVDSFRVMTATSGEEALAQLQNQSPDMVLLDVLLPGMDGLETLEKIRNLYPRLNVVMLSCLSDTRKVVQAIRLGAQDYLTKPFQKADLDAVMQQCLGGSKNHPPAVQGEIEDLGDDVFFVAGSASMRKIRSQAKLVANVDIPVLILGESGTGKEVIARLIHNYSPRAHRTFLKVNCAAVPADLLESELFGYEPGAFTGAVHAKPGKFEICNKGTILLDEIGEMPPQLQAKLLHVLQDGTFSRLGSRNIIKADVRVLAATNINIEEAIATRKLREDLYYRLNGFSINLPPLRERKEEIPLLLRHFMSQVSERYTRPSLPLSPKLMEACERYNWPGNLRELGNFVKRFLILGDEDLALSDLTPARDEQARSASGFDKPDGEGLKGLVRNLKDEAEMEAIAKALEQTNWNRKKAAVLLKISYKALLYKIRQYDLQRIPSNTA